MSVPFSKKSGYVFVLIIEYCRGCLKSYFLFATVASVGFVAFVVADLGYLVPFHSETLNYILAGHCL